MFILVNRRCIFIFLPFQRNIKALKMAVLNRTGFVTMRPDQLNLIYGTRSPYNDSSVLNQLTSMNKSAILAAIEHDVHKIAQLKKFEMQSKWDPYREKSSPNQMAGRRKRNVVLSPVLFAPFILVCF